MVLNRDLKHCSLRLSVFFAPVKVLSQDLKHPVDRIERLSGIYTYMHMYVCTVYMHMHMYMYMHMYMIVYVYAYVYGYVCPMPYANMCKHGFMVKVCRKDCVFTFVRIRNISPGLSIASRSARSRSRA